MVRNLVLGCGLVGAFKAPPGIDMPQFWRYSLQTAGAARWLAQRNEHNADLAYTAGLVHALGHLVMHLAAPQAMMTLDRECPLLASGRAAVERERLGYDHAEVGAELALRWNFPLEVATPLRHVPCPQRSEPPQPLAALVHVAAWRARVEALRPPAATSQADFPQEVAALIGLHAAWLPDAQSIGVQTADAMLLMPPVAELGHALQQMLD
jgi:HD-like signal output (HDOD) protein